MKIFAYYLIATLCLKVLTVSCANQLVAQETISNDSNYNTQMFYDDSDYYLDDEINWEQLFDFFLYSQNKLVNHPMVSIGGGISLPSVSNTILQNTMPYSNYLNLEYGFVRLDSNYRLNELRGYSSEFVFIENNTNQTGLIKASDNEIYTNIFSFGMGLRSGYGIDLSHKELYGLHSTAFIWSYFDYSGYPDSSFFRTFDNEWKFGNKGTAALEYRIADNFMLDLEYEHINTYSGMDYWKWIGSWGVDFVLQHWIDLLDPILINEFEYAYPFMKFFYKNAISIIFSEARQIKQFYPFFSGYSLLDRRFALRLKFIF